MFDELIDAASQDFLTIQQVEILLAKNNGKSYSAIIADFELSGNAALVSCFERTAQFKIWYPGYEGGSDPYLSNLDQNYFNRYITEAADYANCVPAIVASNLAFNFKKKELKKHQLY